MAKKVLTPEEVKAKMEKKSAKRKLFFGTFTKALAFFLAIAMAYSLATIAFTPATVATTGGTVQSGDVQAGGESTDGGDDDVIDFGGDSSTGGDATTGGDSSTGGDATTGGDNSTSGGTTTGGDSSTGGQQSTGMTKADAVKALNDATAKAAKASYKWERESYYTEELQVSNKDALNSVIKTVTGSNETTVEDIVGGFLDITGEGNKMSATVTNGQLPDEGMKQKDKFLLIASSLTEADVKGDNWRVNGNTYMFQLNACNRPQKDGSNALSKITNDFITCDEVNAGLVDAGAGSLVKANDIDVDYKAIVVTAEIVDGKLTSYEISYTMDVNAMELKALSVVTVNGSGAGKMNCKYFDFKY